MPTVDQVKNKVLKILASKFQVQADEDGDVIIHHDSTAVIVSVDEYSKREGMQTVVKIQAMILRDVKRTPALYEWVATKGARRLIGHAVCFDSNNASYTDLNFVHNLMGDNLDENELLSGVLLVIATANELDDELQAKFGGKRLID